MNVYDVEVLERIYSSSFYQTVCVVANSPEEVFDIMMHTYDDVKSITLHAKEAILYFPTPAIDENSEQRTKK